MNIRRIGIAALSSIIALNAWAGGGGAAADAHAKASYDVTGTWTSKIEGGRGPALTTVFVLKQDGEKVTGTVSTNGSPPAEISDGKAGRTAVYFSVSVTMPAMPMPGQQPDPNAKPMTMVTKYTGKVTGNDMELTRQMQMPGGAGAAPMGGGMGGGGMPMGGGGAMGGGMSGGPGGMNAPFTAHRQ